MSVRYVSKKNFKEKLIKNQNIDSDFSFIYKDRMICTVLTVCQ